jgi:hypothetical protein
MGRSARTGNTTFLNDPTEGFSSYLRESLRQEAALIVSE